MEVEYSVLHTLPSEMKAKAYGEKAMNQVRKSENETNLLMDRERWGSKAETDPPNRGKELQEHNCHCFFS